MKVLELFAGSRSIGKVAEQLGMKVFSTDISPFKDIDSVCNIFDFNVDDVPFQPDIIWASPPCKTFSVASMGHHWVKGEPFAPKTEAAKEGIKIVKKTLEIIKHFNPQYFFIENPRGKLRKAPFMQEILIRQTVTYCQYGDTRMKPTDIWTNNISWIPRPICKNGAPCHESAPRGSKTGTQGIKGSYDRSKIPEEFCLEILKSCNYN
jgi:hypothetical protein